VEISMEFPIVGLIAIAVLGYLAYALLYPEEF
jgi:K+-transporting ATPase KdpF subunit